MNLPDFDTFCSQARAEGFDEMLERHWEPHTVVDTHTHPFVVKALVTRGQMWLTVNGQTQALLPGDGFRLALNEPHEERYGPEGATFWAARRR